MPKFRKKPVVIEAVRWTGDNVDEIAEFIGTEVVVKTSGIPQLMIQTLNGPVLSPVGEWIIKGVQGEFYPCANDIFNATYEPA